MRQLSDQELLEKCRYDNSGAYNILFQRYFKSLYHYALKFTRDKALAEELVMDVMLRLWQKRTGLPADVNLSSYLFKAIKNTLIDHWRSRELQTVDILEVEEEIALQARPADYSLNSREMEDVYHETIDALSPQRKLIFKMSREEELTYPQIAERMNISVNTVKTQMTSALRGIRIKLNHHTDVSLIWASAMILFFS